MNDKMFTLGAVTFEPEIQNGLLQSLGQVRVSGVPLRNAGNRFLPWFDTYDGDIFRRFRFEGMEQIDGKIRIRTTAVSDPDVMFMERRDSSGDLVFRASSWDAKPLEAKVEIILEPATARFEGRIFEGFRYWFEVESPQVELHRFLDRQTWEIGGHLEGNSQVLRNWSHYPLSRLSKDENFSSGGLVEQFVVALPGNLWARWSMMPAFDFQYGPQGCLVAWFDSCTLIRSLFESVKGEDYLRVLDFHWFEKTKTWKSNPKTILFSAGVVDDVTAANLWTRVYEQEKRKVQNQFGIKPEPPQPVVVSRNQWVGFHYDQSYEDILECAADLGADFLFVDPVWENEQSLVEELGKIIPKERVEEIAWDRIFIGNMCVTLDWEVAKLRGGEEALKRLCDRAAKRGVGIISWVCAHASSRMHWNIRAKYDGNKGLGLFAARESGRHPDTGYPSDVFTLNLNSEITEELKEKVLGVCERTGLKGFLWDSFSNIGWWQVNYGNGSMRPQFDRMAELYRAYNNAGLTILPEGIASFSNNNCLGMAGGMWMPCGIQGVYGYDSLLRNHADTEEAIMKAQVPMDMAFQWFAHRHPLSFSPDHSKYKEWNPERVEEMKALIRLYKQLRNNMVHRTILPDVAGVRWTDAAGQKEQLWVFAGMECPGEGWKCAIDGTPATGRLPRNRVFVRG